MMSENMEQDRIEDNLRQTRSRLDGRLGELQEKLAPGQVVTDVLDYVRGHGGQEFATNLLASAQKNPLPAVVAGVGLAWLIAVNFRGPATATTEYTYGQAYNGNLHQRVRDAEAGVMRGPDEDETSYSSRLNDVRGNVLGVARQAQETASSYAQRVQDVFSSAAASAGQSAHDLRDQARGAAGQIGDAAAQGRDQLLQSSAAAQDAGKKMLAALTDNPVALGALGLAAGALLGLLLPSSDQEEAALGGVAGTARETIRGVAQDVVDRGSGVVREVMDKAQQSAAAKGFTTDRPLEELTGDLASGAMVDDATALARDVMQAGKEALHKAAANGAQKEDA